MPPPGTEVAAGAPTHVSLTVVSHMAMPHVRGTGESSLCLEVEENQVLAAAGDAFCGFLGFSTRCPTGLLHSNPVSPDSCHHTQEFVSRRGGDWQWKD